MKQKLFLKFVGSFGLKKNKEKKKDLWICKKIMSSHKWQLTFWLVMIWKRFLMNDMLYLIVIFLKKPVLFLWFFLKHGWSCPCFEKLNWSCLISECYLLRIEQRIMARLKLLIVNKFSWQGYSNNYVFFC